MRANVAALRRLLRSSGAQAVAATEAAADEHHEIRLRQLRLWMQDVIQTLGGRIARLG
jgi:hypothetical protein